ncbi:capsid assembly scaffolding protein Gp46 family protein [Bacillus mycoides]|uniref:capsid assembly scaffolding protein Gp46 family protein n=1 Tax=Bacillus mycoides TaxID=1405 RepID=UPI003D65B317
MKKVLVNTGIVKPAIRLSDIKNGLQFFSEGGEEGDDGSEGAGGSEGGEKTTFTKEEMESQIQAEVNRVAGKIRKEEARKAKETAEKEFGDKSKTEIETLMDEMRTIKEERDQEKKTASDLKMKDFAISKLSESGFGAGFASNVIGATEEDTLKKIEAFKTNLDGELTKRVKSNLADKTPGGSKGAEGEGGSDPIRDAFMKEWS